LSAKFKHYVIIINEIIAQILYVAFLGITESIRIAIKFAFVVIGVGLLLNLGHSRLKDSSKLLDMTDIKQPTDRHPCFQWQSLKECCPWLSFFDVMSTLDTVTERHYLTTIKGS